MGDKDDLTDLALQPIEVIQKSGPADRLRVVDHGEEGFTGPCVDLRPHKCSLGSAGRLRSGWSSPARGVWRGCITHNGDAAEAAALLLPVLTTTVELDVCGVMATATADLETLRFLLMPSEERIAAASILDGGVCTGFRLMGPTGQVLTHKADLWMATPSDNGGFEVLLRLTPRTHGRGSPFCVDRRTPLGKLEEVWEEVPMVEMPRLLRITMSSTSDELALPGMERQRYLVEEEDTKLVINCWRRRDGEDVEPVDEAASESTRTDGLALEQLMWLDALGALAQTSTCAEVPVPSARVRLSDEGTATRSELLNSQSAHGVPSEDAAKIGSLAFLGQYVPVEVFDGEVLPRLLPAGGGTIRVLSAELADASATRGRPAPARRPRNMDDLFSETADFRVPCPWASTDDSGTEDPLANHELTSVFLLSETSGFAVAFHCIEAKDPCDLNS